MGQAAATGGGDHHEVFDTETAEAATIDAGFHGHHVPDLELGRGCLGANGSSWITSPTPWPVPWMNQSP